jgi:hypothetical protein
MSKISREKKKKKLAANPHLVKTDVCQDCGNAFPVKDLKYGDCPFASEIYNEKVETVLCGDCYHERCMDI